MPQVMRVWRRCHTGRMLPLHRLVVVNLQPLAVLVGRLALMVILAMTRPPTPRVPLLVRRIFSHIGYIALLAKFTAFINELRNISEVRWRSPSVPSAL